MATSLKQEKPTASDGISKKSQGYFLQCEEDKGAMETTNKLTSLHLSPLLLKYAHVFKTHT